MIARAGWNAAKFCHNVGLDKMRWSQARDFLAGTIGKMKNPARIAQLLSHQMKGYFHQLETGKVCAELTQNVSDPILLGNVFSLALPGKATALGTALSLSIPRFKTALQRGELLRQVLTNIHTEDEYDSRDLGELLHSALVNLRDLQAKECGKIVAIATQGISDQAKRYDIITEYIDRKIRDYANREAALEFADEIIAGTYYQMLRDKPALFGKYLRAASDKITDPEELGKTYADALTSAIGLGRILLSERDFNPWPIGEVLDAATSSIPDIDERAAVLGWSVRWIPASDTGILTTIIRSATLMDPKMLSLVSEKFGDLST